VADCVSPGAELAGGLALAVCSGVGGDVAPEVPGGGLFGADPGLPGAVDELGGALPDGAGDGVLLAGGDEFPPPDPLAFPPAELVDPPEDEAPVDAPLVAPGAALGSALRMIGSPSLPEPMTTTFELGDCAKSSVASIPRQRRYDSEIPWLTVF
jgi:hypothetical protein